MVFVDSFEHFITFRRTVTYACGAYLGFYSNLKCGTFVLSTLK